MSTLNDNLLQIYNTKLEIKDAIGTNSDVFAEYPDLIRGIKNGIVPTGTLSYAVPVDMYGPYVADVTSYSYVSVSLGESSAYIYANGEYTPADFGYAAINSNIIVNVPGPSGNKVISYNGNYDISSYASVTVNVEGGGSGDDFTNEDGMFYSMTGTPDAPLLSWGEGVMTYSEPVSANYLYDTEAELRYDTFGAIIETFYTGYQPICQIFDHEGDKTWKDTEQFGAYISYETDNQYGVVTFYNSLSRGAYSGRFKLYAYGSNAEFTSSYSCKGWCNWQIIQFDMS